MLDKCWTCGNSERLKVADCLCNGTGLHVDEVAALMEQSAQLNYCLELLRDLHPFVSKALPTHLERGGEADRQCLLQRLNKVIKS